MVFAFPTDVTNVFTNQFVPIDLDIGWLDAKGRMVDFTTMDAFWAGRGSWLCAAGSSRCRSR